MTLSQVRHSVTIPHETSMDQYYIQECSLQLTTCLNKLCKTLAEP